MKWKARTFDFSLFAAGLLLALVPGRLVAPVDVSLRALVVFWLFSIIYYRFRITTASGTTAIDYGINYTWAFAIYTGPVGAFAFEFLYAFSIYAYKKLRGKADPDEGLDMFYNIGSYTVIGSLCYYLYTGLYSLFDYAPYGDWVLLVLLVALSTLFTHVNLFITFTLSRDLDLRDKAANLIRSPNWADLAKVSITNAMLAVLLREERWDMMILLFLLNYIVSLSFYSKSQNIQNKFERDKFEQMAYRDFLTGVHNRAYMDQRMKELDRSGESIGILVTDIDKFKKINDTYNHAVGDRVIRHLAESLQTRLRTGDYLFRSGGEEFTIFLRGRSYDECREWTRRRLEEIGSSSVEAEYGDQTTTIHYTVSFGLYYFTVGRSVMMERGYVYADQLLLESKRQGRNRLSAASDTSGPESSPPA
ncbi:MULTISPECIES: GGDEF domain-containing protein [Paenibacillus]|uniref:GGDEF domain-containing protein n=1 Tax=Paenibacillus TaxID=44249 RepID=UPI001CC46B95|nr:MULTISPECIES: GGDEF domain-containing protein [Paenibacillus]